MAVMWIPKRLVEAELVNLAGVHPSQLVDYCEKTYENNIIKAASSVSESGCKIVMLSGPSGSGKTTSAHKIGQELQLRGTHAVVVSLDDFYLGVKDYPRLSDGSKDYENIHALDVDHIHKCLRELIEKGEAEFPEFDFMKEQRKPNTRKITLGNGVVIIEGIHALNPVLTDMLESTYIHRVYAGMREEYSRDGMRFLPTRDMRLVRRMVRDDLFRGHSLEKTIEMWPRVCDGENRYIKAYKVHADFLLDTSFSCEMNIMSTFVTPLTGRLGNSPAGQVLDDIAERLSVFRPIAPQLLPPGSMLREFVGEK